LHALRVGGGRWGTYQKCVAETVRRFDGFVAKYLGDGVLVYFGYPRAHEDDAERAVRAGLELIVAVTGPKAGASLQTRVGIATGLVVVGDLMGSGDTLERGIVGETPNLAARLQSLAEPNMVVIAGSTKSLLGTLFELQELGARDLKGIAGPVQGAPLRLRKKLADKWEQLFWTIGLCHVGIAASRARLFLIPLHGERADYDDGRPLHPGKCLDPTGCLVAVEQGHLDVHEHEIRPLGLGLGDALDTIDGLDDGIAGGREEIAQNSTQILLILEDENTLRHGR
jgi:hypothetical protein